MPMVWQQKREGLDAIEYAEQCADVDSSLYGENGGEAYQAASAASVPGAGLQYTAGLK